MTSKIDELLAMWSESTLEIPKVLILPKSVIYSGLNHGVLNEKDGKVFYAGYEVKENEQTQIP